MRKSSLPLSVQKCRVPCFQPIAAARGGPLFARDGCSYNTTWSNCLWRTQLLWSAGLGLRQSPGHRNCQDSAPFCGVPPQSTWYCGGAMELFRLTAVQVLNSSGSFHHAPDVCPPVQVCQSSQVILDILTSFIQIWQVVGNSFLSKFNEITYVEIGKNMQTGPREESLWRKAHGRQISWCLRCRETSAMACAFFIPRSPALGHRWIRNLAAAVCCSWTYLFNCHIFSRIIMSTSVPPATWKTFPWFPPKKVVFFKGEVICFSDAFWRAF